MLLNCDWLPLLELQQPEESDLDYENRIYNIFLGDFQDTHPELRGLPVVIRCSPIVDGKLQAFYHVTTWGDDKDNRNRDDARIQRIRWIRAFIEHSDCKPIHCDECTGMKMCSAPYKGKSSRIKILLEEEKYIVILEKREQYILLITAYYVDHTHRLDKLLKEYNEYKAKSAST